MGEDHFACLLGNHGLLAVGGNLSYTLDVAQQIEFVSQLYYNTRMAGGAVNLTPKDMEIVLGSFQNYRKK